MRLFGRFLIAVCSEVEPSSYPRHRRINVCAAFLGKDRMHRRCAYGSTTVQLAIRGDMPTRSVVRLHCKPLYSPKPRGGSVLRSSLVVYDGLKTAVAAGSHPPTLEYQ
jgi:hypothetical protein